MRDFINDLEVKVFQDSFLIDTIEVVLIDRLTKESYRFIHQLPYDHHRSMPFNIGHSACVMLGTHYKRELEALWHTTKESVTMERSS